MICILSFTQIISYKNIHVTIQWCNKNCHITDVSHLQDNLWECSELFIFGSPNKTTNWNVLIWCWVNHSRTHLSTSGILFTLVLFLFLHVSQCRRSKMSLCSSNMSIMCSMEFQIPWRFTIFLMFFSTSLITTNFSTNINDL